MILQSRRYFCFWPAAFVPAFAPAFLPAFASGVRASVECPMPSARPTTRSSLPQPPHAGEVWWVAVQGAPGPSGGWVVLADPGAQGAAQIQAAFEKAGIGVLAAVDAATLASALAPAAPARPETSVVVLHLPDGRVQAQVQPGAPGEALLAARLAHPDATVVLVESQDAAYALCQTLSAIAQSGDLAAVRMDLRAPPRGAGAWGLACWRAR